MNIHKLNNFFNPQRIALICVTANPNSVGDKVLGNLVGRRFRGVVFVTAFPVEDSFYAVHAGTGRKIGRNSQVIESADTPEGEIRTYLEPGEILKLFGN